MVVRQSMAVCRIFFLAVLAIYKQCLSPFLPPACRFVPTCSEYTAEAIDHFGILHGSLLAAWRLLRCQPLCQAGYDPVPTRFGPAAFLSKTLTPIKKNR
ncbi:putative membrane protein insertion efficiency factor [Desulfovibrionales bacterium]